MLYLILRDFDSADAGAYVDPMHMTIEGGRAGWEMGLDWSHPGLPWSGSRTSAGFPTKRDGSGQQRFRWEYCPLADGQAPLPEFFAYLKQLKYDGIVSLHSDTRGRPASDD